MSDSRTLDRTAPEVENATPTGLYPSVFKPMADIVLALLFGLIALPIVLFSALLVMRDGSSPFYFQMRVGRNGRRFKMWKIRTMVVDADCRLAEHLEACPQAREEWAQYQKLRKDPRVTRVGRFLRKTSIDELPQFWNVLRGDMSVVGPRPMMVGQEELYPGESYYALKPGLTGPWQVSDRNHSSFADRAHFDDAYLTRISFGTDMRLIVQTFRSVLSSSGY